MAATGETATNEEEEEEKEEDVDTHTVCSVNMLRTMNLTLTHTM